MKLKEQLWTRIFWSNTLFYVFILLMLIPTTRKAIQIQLVRLTSFSAHIDSDKSFQKIIDQGDLSMVLISENGEEVNLEQFRNKGIFINLWATWCPPCVAEMPSIDELYTEIGEEFNFVLISREPIEKLKKFKQNRGYNFAVYQVAGGMPELFAKSNSIPATYILDKEGHLILEHRGPKNWASKKFVQSIKVLI